MKLNRNLMCMSAAAVVAVLFPLATRVGAQDAPVANPTTKLPDVVVQGEVPTEPGYVSTNASTALKTDIPLLQTPQAVSVVPRAQLDDQRALKLEDAIKNVSGVTVGGYYSDWDYYRIRGFDAAFTTYWDGLRGDYGMSPEIYGMERVEVVKGPASALYGQGPLGGMVNLVSKRPRPENFADVQFTGGEFNFYEPAADVGLTLNEDRTVYARITALYRDQDSFVDYANKQRLFVAPAVTWEIGEATKITFLSQFWQDWNLFAMPLPARGTVLPNLNGRIPTDRFLGDPNGDKSEQWRARLGYQFEHQFNESFSLRQILSLNRMKQDWPDLLYPSTLDADDRTLYRYPYDYEETLDRVGVDTALDVHFTTGNLEHKLTTGVDYYYTRSDSTSRQIDYSDFPGSYPALDLFNPVYGPIVPNYATTASSKSDSSLVGLYVQDHIQATEQLTVTLGARFDWTSSGSDSEQGFSPRAGLTYELVKGIAAYGNYSQSFNPQWFSRDATGNVVDPETGDNFELGLKSSLWDGRMNTLLAVYQLTRRDVATANLATPDPFDSIAAGEQRSRGVEAEGSFQLSRGFDLTAAYTYTDAEITEDNNLPVGARLAGVPEHMFSAWLKYTFREGPLQGLGFGFGGRYYTEQEGDATYTNPFELPAYGLLDAAIYYNKGRFSAQVNVNNLADKRYFAGAYNDLYVLPGEPRTIRATVGWTF
jgi:iron complex outermembrane receptor protein